jgi:heme oxygenase
MTLLGAEATTEEKPIRFRLRAATASVHARVDTYMGGLLRQTDRGYEQFLTATAHAVLPLERALCEARVSELVHDWPLRCRSDALREDLAALSIAEPDTHPIHEGPRLRDEAFMLGALYVLEGSRLGARVLLGMLGATHSHALRYLSHGHGLPLWQTFLAQLEASSAVRRNPESAEAGASAAFRPFLPKCRLQIG